jgi:hypothetical protein
MPFRFSGSRKGKTPRFFLVHWNGVSGTAPTTHLQEVYVCLCDEQVPGTLQRSRDCGKVDRVNTMDKREHLSLSPIDMQLQCG